MRTRQFQLLSDINLVWDFMVETYDRYAANGVAAPFFEYALTSTWMDKAYTHLNRMWWVPQNRLAYMEPLCTIPEYRKLGLAAAALTRHYHRMKALGAKYMTGGNNEFYQKLGYEEGWHWVMWKKEV